MPILNQETIGQTIDYTYDPLGRLTAADYSTGDYYHYTYDEVGNRLSQDSSLNNQQTTTNYTYDNANRMIQAGNATYTWDNNGNLLNDGAKTYTYDPANRLAGVVQGSNTYTYAYNGLGDRLQQIANGQTTNYTLDINSGLTQVLDDGTNTYTYGVDRISQQHGSTAEYYLDDALGSVRQLTDASDAVTLSESYDPYGNVISRVRSSGTSVFGYTGEQADQSGLTYLRARYYSSDNGRFLSRDNWKGDLNNPLSLNRWEYVMNNPINHYDPTGNIPLPQDIDTGRQVYSCNCGWIDFGHAGSGLAMSIFDALNEEGKRFPSTNNEVRQDVFAVSPSADIKIWLSKQIVSLTAVVSTGLDEARKDSVALGIYRSLEEKVEFTQGAG